jgi:hypothetical protein
VERDRGGPGAPTAAAATACAASSGATSPTAPTTATAFGTGTGISSASTSASARDGASPLRQPRAGLLAFGGSLYVNNQATGTKETTGNILGPGAGLELDVGARLAKRYVPYLGLELGLVPPGHRFENDPSSVRAGTSFLGLGFRVVAGDVDTIAFVADLSLGRRTFSITSDGSTWTMSGFEFPRLGLGAEIRINSHFAVSPMITLSGGTMTDTSGSISFAPNQGDLKTMPPFTGSGGIPSAAQASYYAVFLGAGMHVDLFGH